MKRALIVGAAVLVGLPLAAVGAAAWLLNGDAVKSRLVEQVRRSTGRDLVIAGPVSLAWSFAPTIALSDVSFANPPGFPQPQMAHVDRIEVQLALAPLFHREIDVRRVAVVGPSIRLERDAAGHPNWDFTTSPGPAMSQAAPSQPAERFKLAVGTVEITDATIAYGAQRVTAPHLAYDPASGRVDGTLATAGETLALSGTAGPIAPTAYPVDLKLAGMGAAVSLTGTSAAAQLRMTATDLAALSPVVGRPLPSIRDVTLSAALPGPGALRLHTGKLALGAFTLERIDAAADSVSAPATVDAAVTLGALPLSIGGHLGSIAGLLTGATPVDVHLAAPGLSGTASGTIAVTGAGELHLAMQAPDLGATGVQAGVALPALRDLALTTDLKTSAGGAAATNLHLTSAQGDLSGDVTMTAVSRPRLIGTLTSTRLDLDALHIAALPPATPAAPAAPSNVPPPVPQPSRAIPDLKLPLAGLGAADADLGLAVGSLELGGAEWQAVRAHAVLREGTLRIDPISAMIGTGRADATVQLSAAPPGLRVTIDAPGLPFGPIAALAGGAATAPGTLDLRADLAGAGDTARAIAATLTGHVGLALVDAQLDNAVLARLAAGPLRAVNVSLDGGGTTIRCAALRADAAAGHVDLRALTLDTSKLALDGGGTIDLAGETMDLHLRPQLRLGGGLSVPIRVRGTLAAPKVTLDPGAIASGRIGIVIGGAPPPDTCGPALALARDGQAGMAAAAPAPSKPLKPADLLRGLLR